jgi:3-keto-disaccharide hydrolase
MVSTLCHFRSTARFLLIAAIAALVPPLCAVAQDDNHPPKGFTALFNGHDFDDWTGGATRDPREIAALPADKRAEWEQQMKKGIKEHWRVENGELVSDGHDPYLATTRDFGDFEMWVDWKIGPKGDSGIYLRGVPQVQIWDPTDEKAKSNGADKGSGGLWNNKKNERFPPVVADNPIGEWNRMYIRMVGPYVLVKLNGKKVVDNVIMENYYDPKIPVFNRGPIYLQTHGSETRFRNIFLREIPAKASNRLLSKIKGKHAEFKPIFNGKDLSGWTHATDNYEVVDGAIRCKKGHGGVLQTSDTYENFAVQLEFKLPPAGNNGLAIRTPDDVRDSAYDGMELQILDDTADMYKDLHDYQFCGSLYGLAPARRGFLRPVGEWNFEEVTVDGNQIVVELNGYEILDVDVAKVREKPLDGKAHPGASRTSGHFGFCGHTDPVEFRNIRIKRLPST